MTRNREAVMVNKWLPKASSIPDLTLALREQPDSLRLLALKPTFGSVVAKSAFDPYRASSSLQMISKQSWRLCALAHQGLKHA